MMQPPQILSSHKQRHIRAVERAGTGIYAYPHCLERPKIKRMLRCNCGNAFVWNRRFFFYKYSGHKRNLIFTESEPCEYPSEVSEAYNQGNDKYIEPRSGYPAIKNVKIKVNCSDSPEKRENQKPDIFRSVFQYFKRMLVIHFTLTF